MQTTSKIFMVKPTRFGYNEETAQNNAFQRNRTNGSTQENALREFLSYTTLLKANDVNVVMAEDTPEPFTPDSIFPNNWFSTHEDGTLVLYPMFAKNRREERKAEFLDLIKKNFNVRRLVDLSFWETENRFLEGTGSMVLDRTNKVAYVCRSQRSNEMVLADFCKKLGYSSVLFDAVNKDGNPIYHTNVMMTIGTQTAIVCMEAIKAEDRNNVREKLVAAGKEIMEISFEQMNRFAGNMLEINNIKGDRLIVMSATARKSLDPEQIKFLNRHYARILSPQLDTIETNGGGSARCMMAELMITE